MLTFPCPSCATKLQVADEDAGKTIQCPKCQQKAIAPNSAEESEAISSSPVSKPAAPETGVEEGRPKRSRAATSRDDDDGRDDDDRPRRRRDASEKSNAGTIAGLSVTVLVVLGVGGCCGLSALAILVALLVPAVQKVREAAARTQSVNNLKQIGLAFHAYHDMHKHLPTNGTGPAVPGNDTTGSWGYQILPFIDQAPLFQQANRAVGIPTYMCPGRGRPSFETTNGGGAWTDYFYNNYLNDPTRADQPNAPDNKRTLMGVTDGTSTTVFMGHGNINQDQYSLDRNVAGSTNIFNGGTPGTMRSGVADPGGGNPAGVFLLHDSRNNPNIGSWGGPFPQGALMGMGDGSVRMFPYSTNNFSAFLTPTGKENVLLPN